MVAAPKLEKALAAGRTAEIYPWKEDSILKLFYPSFTEGHVHDEARVARAVQAAGLPVPAVGEIVAVGGRLGIAYERVAGPTMWAVMAARPWRIPSLARLLATLHGALHDAAGIAGIPAQHERLARKIQAAPGLSPGLRQQALQRLQRLPPGNRLCHGDFHAGNVILGDYGPVIIDWTDVASGNPLADVARSSLLAQGEAAAGRTLTWLLRLGLRLAHRQYVRHTFRQRPGREEYRRWLPVVAAARLSEGIVELEAWLQRQVEVGLAHDG